MGTCDDILSAVGNKCKVLKRQDSIWTVFNWSTKMEVSLLFKYRMKLKRRGLIHD